MLLTLFYLERHVMESKNNFWELIFISMPTRVSRRSLLLDRLLLKNVYDLANDFHIFFKNMLLTLFYLERHVMGSTNYFWELIFILMPTRVSRRFLLMGPSFAEKRVWFSQELPIFFQKYAAYTILSRKTYDGEQKLFWELIFISMPTRVSRRSLLLDRLLLKNVYDLAENFQIFFKNMLLTLFYLERYVMESTNYFWELIFILMPTRVSWRFLLIGPSFAEKRVWFSQELLNFLQKYAAYTILSRKNMVMESKNYFGELIFISMPTRVSRRSLLIGPSFAEKRVWFSQELPNFLQTYVAYTILSRKTCDGVQKLFLRINLHINAHKGIETIFAVGPSFAENVYDFSQWFPNFLQKYVAYTILSRKTCDGEYKLFLRINLHINAHKGIETIFVDGTVFWLKNVYDLAKNFQFFFKNMLLTLFYLEKHMMESKNYFWELIFISMPTRVSRRSLLLDRLLLKNVYDLAENFQIFFKNMLLTLFYLERYVMESTNYFWELIFILMPTRVSWRFLLIGPSFAEKRVWFSQELLNFLQKYAAYTILSRKTCNGEQKLFWRINLHINAHKGIETIFADWTVFCWKTCMI